MNKHSKPKTNHFFSEQLKQSYNYEAQSIIQKKNFLDIDNRFSKKHQPQQINRSTTSKIQFYEQQIRQLDQINQNFVQRLATSQIELKQYHFDVIKLNQQINNLERSNLQVNQKYEVLLVESKENEKYILELESKIKTVEEIITKLYKTISNNQNNSYKDLEYIFNTDSSVQKQLETICYVMLQCCRQNSLLRKTLSEQENMITKLDRKTADAYFKSNVQLEATSKLLTEFQPFPSTMTFEQKQREQYKLSPYRTPSRNTSYQKNKYQSRAKYSNSNTRQRQDPNNWQRNKLKSQLREIDVQINRLQAKLIDEMRH